MLQTLNPGDVSTGTDFGLRRASTYERQRHIGLEMKFMMPLLAMSLLST